MMRSGYHDHFDAAMAASSIVGLVPTPLARITAAFEQMGQSIGLLFAPIIRVAEALGRERV